MPADPTPFPGLESTRRLLESRGLSGPLATLNRLEEARLAAEARAEALSGEVGRLRVALEWYVDPANWEREMCYSTLLEDSKAHEDEGQRAREALAPTPEEA